MALSKAEQWPAIVETFRSSGIGWARRDAEALWIIAEAYARENDCAEAYVIYVSLLKEHDDASERRATIEHAIRLIPMAMVEKLVALGRKDAGQGGEFAPIAIDLCTTSRPGRSMPTNSSASRRSSRSPTIPTSWGWSPGTATSAPTTPSRSTGSSARCATAATR